MTNKKLKPRGLVTDRRYKDAPRFETIYEYEDEFRKSYDKHMKMMFLELKREMIKLK